MKTEEIKETVDKPVRKWVVHYLLKFWFVSVVIIILTSEFLLIPNSIETAVSERINQFQYALKMTSRLADSQPSVAAKYALLDTLNKNSSSQNWQKIVYAPEQNLREQAKNDQQSMLLLQSLPGTDYAYGLWFNTKSVVREKFKMGRLIELTCIVLLSLLFIALWVRRTNFIDLLDKVAVSAKELSQGDFNTPLPSNVAHPGLRELVSSFEIMRKSLMKMRRELLTQIEAKNLGEQRLQESHKVALIGSWEWLVKDDCFWCSESLYDILGIEKNSERINAETFFSQVHSADKKKLMSQLRDNLKEGSVISAEFRLMGDSGQKNIHLIAKIKRQKNTAPRLIGTCQDITERKGIESLLKKLSSAITASNSGMMITDVIGTVEYINPKYAEATGFELEELEGTAAVMLSRECLPEEKYDSMWQDILGGAGWRGDLENIRKDGSVYWSTVAITPIKNEYDELTHFVIVIEDISELKDAKAKMEQLALYDELTGLPNRRMFFRELERLFSKDVMKSPAVVMLLDLDNFKTINDAQGHPAGDKLLIEVASRLEQNLLGEGLAARLGGDEFAVLINPVQNVEQVERIAKNTLDIIGAPYIINGSEIQISTSIGLAWLPKDGNMPDTILKHADLAMYQAKELGRNQYRHFTKQLNEQVQRYIRFSKEMPEGLVSGQFYLDFQPKVDLKANKIVGVEALIRWKHPELGIISPFDFVSIAEETGFIVPLGNWVFAEACRSMKKLREMGYPDISCAINISLRQFSDPSLLGVMAKSIRDNDITASNLEVEITESLLMENVDKAIMTLKEIQKLGLSVAIDDFGTGYSSFSYLKNLPIDVLKVDRVFIKDIPLSEGDMKITSAIISMAHSLNLKVVAEGIETDAQRLFLVEQNCDIGQGYLFGKPVSLARLKETLDKAPKEVLV